MLNFSSNKLVPIDTRIARFGESKNNKTDQNHAWKLGPGILYSKAYQDRFEQAQKNASIISSTIAKANSAEMLKKYEPTGRVWHNPNKIKNQIKIFDKKKKPAKKSKRPLANQMNLIKF